MTTTIEKKRSMTLSLLAVSRINRHAFKYRGTAFKIITASFLFLVPGALGFCSTTVARDEGAIMIPGDVQQKFNFKTSLVSNSYDESAAKEISDQLSQNENEVRADVNKLLKHPVEVEEAPSIPITCEDDPSHPSKRVMAYVTSASKPELELFLKLLASQRDKGDVGMANENQALEKCCWNVKRKKF